MNTQQQTRLTTLKLAFTKTQQQQRGATLSGCMTILYRYKIIAKMMY